MCIRDRSKFKYAFLLVFSIAQLITIVLYMGKNYEYLLLLAFPSSIILSRMLRFLPKYWMREVGLWTVSYTHLDVYKRQVESCSMISQIKIIGNGLDFNQILIKNPKQKTCNLIKKES